MNNQDARRSLAKWLNEEPNAPIDRVALATLLADYDRLAAIREGLGKAQGEPFGYLHMVPGRMPDFHFKAVAHEEMMPVYIRQQADSAPSLEGISVSLCAPTASEPFRRLECSVVDIGHADRSLVVECKELVSENKALHACLDGSERATQMYAKSAYDCMASARVLVEALEFYADKSKYRGSWVEGVHDHVMVDRGQKARQSIAAHKSEVKG